MPFVERSSGGIRMFQESDIEWLQGDDTIDLRLSLFQHQRKVLQKQMEELQHTMEMVDYKCWYYETAQKAGTVEVPQEMDLARVPERFRKIRQELRMMPENFSLQFRNDEK